MAIPLAVAVAGTAISAWAKYEAGKAEAGAFGQSAKAKRIQAKSVMERFRRNAEFTKLEGKSFKEKQLAYIAEGNVDIGSGFSLSALESTASMIERKIEIAEIEAMANRDALLMDADLDAQRAKDAERGGMLGAVGSVAQGFMMGAS